MVFYPPSWAPKLTDADIPDDQPLSEFLFDDRLRPHKCQDSPSPFVDSIDGSGYSVQETRQRIEWLAAGLARQLGISDVTGDVWDRVVSVFAVNNVSDTTTRLSESPLTSIFADSYTSHCLGCTSS